MLKIQNNGYFSDIIPIEGSVHQGGVNSVNYFLCVAEILALKLRSNQKIDGVPIDEIISLLNQYADDMDVASLFKQSSLDAILDDIENFHPSTGFSVNYDKTKLYRIGSLKNSKDELITQRSIAWTSEPINVLGVWICHDKIESIARNYDTLLVKVKAILGAWRSRSLTLIGKILIINTLIASLFVYKMLVLNNLPEKIIKQLESEFQLFIWNGKKPKIALSTLQRNKNAGGLRLVDIRLRERALKASCVKIIAQDESVANFANIAINKHLKNWVFDCNLKKEDVKFLNVTNKFWEDMMYA